jgi:hypothetical protein
MKGRPVLGVGFGIFIVEHRRIFGEMLEKRGRAEFSIHAVSIPPTFQARAGEKNQSKSGRNFPGKVCVKILHQSLVKIF